MASILRPSHLLFVVFVVALALLLNPGNFPVWTEHVKSNLEGIWPYSAAHNAALIRRCLQKLGRLSQSVAPFTNSDSYFGMAVSSGKSHFRVLRTFRPEYSPSQIT